MIHSMTAFARGDYQPAWGTLSIELRSVNHRYLDVSFRLPDELRMLEPRLRERIAGRLNRGKVDCNIRFRRTYTADSELTINTEFATQLANASREVDHLLYNPAPVNSLDVLRWPGVLEMPELDMEAVQEETLGYTDALLQELVETRAREGAKLKDLILQRLAGISETAAAVKERLPAIVSGYRERLQTRLAEIEEKLDHGRLEQEIAIMAQKIDVAEELDRLAAHVTEVRRVLEQDQPVGRRLDFLMQELNREANTLGSKSVDTGTTAASVELKVLIEQMREQVQNIE